MKQPYVDFEYAHGLGYGCDFSFEAALAMNITKDFVLTPASSILNKPV
jgi:hypothetical protein